MKQIIIDGQSLRIEDVIAVARHGEKVALAESAKEAIKESRQWVEQIVERGEPVYGINTGFGIFAEHRIPSQDSAQLSRNLILSHAVGTGKSLDEEIVKAAILVRANTLSKGFSGVRVSVVETLIALLNKGVTPIVPSQGSLGSSGDLAPLSHLALVFTTDEKDDGAESGQAIFEGEILSGKEAMKRAGIERIILGSKEGLALNNGATFSAAIGALAVHDAETLLNAGEISLSMTLEAVMGCSAAFDERLHRVRGHKGQMRVAQSVRELTEGSSLINAYGRVQDAYSLRCAPQVQGVAWDTLDFVKRITETEINAATDNPLLFSPGVAVSGGNFHGEPVGVAMDFLSIVMSEVASISERRVFRLTDGHLNADLPPMLVDRLSAAGLNSGLMMPQYTAASLVLENQTLASPDSVRSLPTSAEQEDHNANAMTAARHTREIIANTAHVIAIELYTAARALDLRLRQDPDLVLGKGTGKAYSMIRENVPYQAGDAWWSPEIDEVKNLILNERLTSFKPNKVDF
ncbi:MAG: Histidine ammonia-lyase [Anaerolineaceae bacterium 46_22]|nr:MAG: Histidine ammonia-lyase [Anaerolineaceae bacterium 46_22]